MLHPLRSLVSASYWAAPFGFTRLHHNGGRNDSPCLRDRCASPRQARPCRTHDYGAGTPLAPRNSCATVRCGELNQARPTRARSSLFGADSPTGLFWAFSLERFFSVWRPSPALSTSRLPIGIIPLPRRLLSRANQVVTMPDYRDGFCPLAEKGGNRIAKRALRRSPTLQPSDNSVSQAAWVNSAELSYNTGESFPSIARRTILIGGKPCFRNEL